MTKKHPQGIVSLGMILLVGGIVVELALVGIFLVFLLSQTNLGIRLSADALAAAHTGIDDGFMNTLRDTPAGTYTINMGNATVIYSLCNGGFACGALGNTVIPVNQAAIIATGSAFNKKRKIVAMIEINPTTRAMKIISEVEQQQ